MLTYRAHIWALAMAVSAEATTLALSLGECITAQQVASDQRAIAEELLARVSRLWETNAYIPTVHIYGLRPCDGRIRRGDDTCFVVRSRQSEGRRVSPSAAIIDSQSVKTAEKGGQGVTMRARR